MSESADDGLSASFAAELARRRERAAGGEVPEEKDDEPFAGVREVVLRDGVPTAIPKRPPPPPASTMGDQVAALLVSPQFLLGCIFSVGSAILLFVIAAADSKAS